MVIASRPAGLIMRDTSLATSGSTTSSPPHPCPLALRFPLPLSTAGYEAGCLPAALPLVVELAHHLVHFRHVCTHVPPRQPLSRSIRSRTLLCCCLRHGVHRARQPDIHGAILVDKRPLPNLGYIVVAHYQLLANSLRHAVTHPVLQHAPLLPSDQGVPYLATHRPRLLLLRSPVPNQPSLLGLRLERCPGLATVRLVSKIQQLPGSQGALALVPQPQFRQQLLMR
mmetsp:Transcript_56179/g.135920  ORF Transcript_56179/g.135920 Transcript_56179/m.135920 type:complete len:226 (-) Transcript_56179:567-1244(-)